MDDDQDDYVGQLREVFDRCDTNNEGRLNREGLLELCTQLQLEDQAEQLIGELLGDSTDGLVRMIRHITLKNEHSIFQFYKHNYLEEINGLPQ